jgi:predicted XRE-type DNA-binding protein
LRKKLLSFIEASKKLKLTQPKISNLNRGQLKNFSLEKLMYILNNLNQDIEIVVRPHATKRHVGDIHVSFL